MQQATIDSRSLGTGGLTVSALGLGCMGVSNAAGPADRADCIATIRHALDRGVFFFDPADAYGGGHNEELLGEAVTGLREQVVLATKFGIEVTPEGVRRINGRPEDVRACAEASLRRLNTDVIDVYYQHRVDKTVPIEDTVGAMSELVTEGKVRYLGLSQASARSIERAVGVPRAPALLALAWWLSRGPDVVPIPGTKRITYLDENVDATQVRLTPEELAVLDGCSPETAWAGQRSSGKLTQGFGNSPERS